MSNMPIKSYLVIAKEGFKDKVRKDITQLSECEVIPSENKNVLAIITETSNEERDRELLKNLNSLDAVQMVTLVAAFSDQIDTIH